MIKQTIKRTLQWTAATFGPHRWRGQEQLVILMYHRVLPPDDVRYQDEQPGMIVHPDTFDMHIRTAAKYFEFVDLHDWVKKAERGEPLPNRALAITFDDGWRDNLEYAVPVLRKHNAPATIFLVSQMVGHSGNYWPEELAAAIRVAQSRDNDIWSHPAFAWLVDLHANVRNARDAEAIDAAINAAKQVMTDAELREKSAAMLRELGDPLADYPRALLNWDEIRDMQTDALIQFGSHTLDHTRLTASLPEDQARAQLVESQQELQSALDSPVPLFCYPNGDHSEHAVHIASEHYTAAVTTKPGWNQRHSHRHTLLRIGLHQGNSATEKAFSARLSGWM